MGDYFHGWRRKVGIVTLLMALVFMAGWVRSFSADDLICFKQHQFNSVCGGLVWERPAQQPSMQFSHFVFSSRDLRNPNHIVGPFESSTPDDKWRRQFAGFVVAEYRVAVTSANKTTSIEANRFYRVPYWSIVIPMTLLSTFLLLTKPRQSNQKKTVELIPEKVA